MLNRAKRAARVLAGRERVAPAGPAFEDMGADFQRLHERAQPFTMTTPERMYALHSACLYIAKAGIAGDYVECGVWRGGSSMMAALTLAEAGDWRQLWLYDTFEGMPEPGEHDVEWTGSSAADELAAADRTAGARNTWAYATLDDVRSNMASTDYPAESIRYVEGKVEDTIPAEAPESIALLRLDTDWYDSTKHELEHLWPRLASGGVLIIDDYGHWQGARQATDEFFAEHGIHVLLNRVDYTGRVALKP